MGVFSIQEYQHDIEPQSAFRTLLDEFRRRGWEYLGVSYGDTPNAIMIQRFSNSIGVADLCLKRQGDGVYILMLRTDLIRNDPQGHEGRIEEVNAAQLIVDRWCRGALTP